MVLRRPASAVLDVSSLYDLMLLLDSDAPGERRQEILGEVESAIASGGSLESKHDWGVRRLAYEIDHRTEAEYHLFQFHSSPELLDSLRRTLRLMDGIVRFRLIRVRPGTPPPPSAARSEGSGERAAGSADAAEAPAAR
jgi:small subunit ribosomal protein S6